MESAIPEPRRIESVDILRGLVMIIMAIDHVRVFSGMPAGGPEAGIFFTRWITHYCAPAFCFFAGTSAFLYYKKIGNMAELRKFLLTRGILLVLLEITVVRFFWSFNFNFNEYMLAGVIWMLGWSMIILSLVVTTRLTLMAIIGLAMIVFQQVFQYVPSLFPESIREGVATWWAFFYPVAAGSTSLAGPGGMVNSFGISILYVLIPWIGVMMVGYSFGSLLLRQPLEVKKLCLKIGLTAIGVFIVAGTVIIMISGESETPFIFRLLGQQKYPPSQLFLLMTLGPVIALVPWADKWKGWLADAVRVIGRVPMFYYLMHLLVIHLSALVLNLILFGTTKEEWYATSPLVWVEEDERWGLPLLYLVWAIDVVILYYLCRWYVGVKKRNPENVVLRYI